MLMLFDADAFELILATPLQALLLHFVLLLFRLAPLFRHFRRRQPTPLICRYFFFFAFAFCSQTTICRLFHASAPYFRAFAFTASTLMPFAASVTFTMADRRRCFSQRFAGFSRNAAVSLFIHIFDDSPLPSSSFLRHLFSTHFFTLDMPFSFRFHERRFLSLRHDAITLIRASCRCFSPRFRYMLLFSSIAIAHFAMLASRLSLFRFQHIAFHY